MNAIPTTTAAPILAIDLGKDKSVTCVYDPATIRTSDPPPPTPSRGGEPTGKTCPGVSLARDRENPKRVRRPGHTRSVS